MNSNRFADNHDWGRIMGEVALKVLGEPPARHGDTWRYGGKDSLVVNVSGAYAGSWHTFYGDDGGGVLAFLHHYMGLDRNDAVKWLRDQHILDSGPRRPGSAPQPTYRGEVRSSVSPNRQLEPSAYARRLWAAAESIPCVCDHPARLWLADRHLWRPELPLPSSVRWISASAEVFRGLHQGAGAIVVAMASPSEWEKAWPRSPSVWTVHLVNINCVGEPSLDRPADYKNDQGEAKPGLGKRFSSPTTGTVVVLGNPLLGESTAPVRIVEGLADSLAIASRFPGPVVSGIGTPARLAKDPAIVRQIAGSPHGVVIHSDRDDPGQKATISLRTSLRNAGADVRAFLPAVGYGKDPGDVAKSLKFQPLRNDWALGADRFRAMNPGWPEWEVLRQASICCQDFREEE